MLGDRTHSGGLRLQVPSKVALRDVTLRDGLQSESIRLDLRQKISLAKGIRDSGIRELEITAFVHPDRVPAMADAEELWAALAGEDGLTCSALVFNRRGLERAIKVHAGRIAVMVSASDAHSRSNTGQGTDEALLEALEVIAQAKGAGLETRSGVICAFGCNLEGKVPLARVLEIAAALAATAPAEMTLADTSGTGDPRQIAERVTAVREIIGDCRLSLHLHNASGWAFANLLAALQIGVRVYDVTLGGLGGCPFLPGAAGNLPAGRVVSFLENLGVKTGVDPLALRAAQEELERFLGRALVPAAL